MVREERTEGIDGLQKQQSESHALFPEDFGRWKK
jgi:hypothetical protein